MKYSLIFTGLLMLSQITLANTVQYVQSATAKLLENPSYKSAVLEKVERGTALKVVEKTDRWTKVVHQNNTGWVSSLLLSSKQPMETTSLLTGHKKQLENTSRRRASSNTTAAATRGLRQSKNARANNNSKADYEALQEIESISIKDNEVKVFHEKIQ